MRQQGGSTLASGGRSRPVALQAAAPRQCLRSLRCEGDGICRNMVPHLLAAPDSGMPNCSDPLEMLELPEYRHPSAASGRHVPACALPMS